MVTEIADQAFENERLLEIIMPASGGQFIFKNCTFKNVALKFESEYITFSGCKFNGDVSIHNQGIGDIDSIALINCQTIDESNTLKVSSADILIGGVTFEEGNVELLAASMLIDKSTIASTLGITFYDELTIRNSELSKLSKLVCSQGDDFPFMVESATINGVMIPDGLALISSVHQQTHRR